MMGMETETGLLVVDGVNLSVKKQARKDADALVSRMGRISAVPRQKKVEFVVCYIASPGGLNGESDLRDWIKAKVTQHVYDSGTEQELVRKAVEGLHRGISLPPRGSLI